MSMAPIAPVAGLSLIDPTIGAVAPAHSAGASPATFGRLLADGLENVSARLIEADRLVQSFAIDDSIPLHQVAFALEQARLSFELMLQVRGRLIEGYQQLMNMQL